MKKSPDNLREFAAITKIVKSLRDPNGGCPWDLKQNHKSLCQYAIEETYELVDAIEQNDIGAMKDELGDVLLQVILHAEIARQNKTFDIYDIIENLSEKMIRRHPHVFSNISVNSSEEVLKNWEDIKRLENQDKKKKTFDLPAHLPALAIANKIGHKAKKYDFDWNNLEQVYAKLDEELKEVKEAIIEKDQNHIAEELGDLLFVIAQLARHLNIDPEQALRGGNNKFISRFDKMMAYCEHENIIWQELTLEEKEKVWQKIKKL